MKSRLFSRPSARPATLRIPVHHTWLSSHITPVLVSAAMVGTLGSALTAQTFSDVAATTTATPATSPTAPAFTPAAAPSTSLSPTTSTTSPSSTASPSSTTTAAPAPKPTTTAPKPAPKPAVKTTAPKPATSTRTTTAPKAASTPKPTATTPKPTTSTTTKATTSSPSVQTSSSFVQQVLQLTNAQRTANGCPALTWSSALASAAQAHSVDMAVHAYFSHTTPSGVTFSQRILAAGYHYSMAAENIAAGQPTPQSVVTAWMNSPGHRANILNCSLKNIGIGYAALKGSPYYYYWTQDFGTP